MTTVTSAVNVRLTKMLLTCGVIAGPLYVVVSLAQALTREGFDMKHHAFSLLTTGDLGWIQLINFLVTGILLIAGAVGVRRVIKGSKGGKWGPILLGAFGAGTALAGIFSADPALGFPPGTPMEGTTISWHGWIHFITASLGFVALIIACFVLARNFAAARQKNWAMWTRVLGVVLIVALVGVSSGSKGDFVTPAFIISASLGYLWVAALSAKLKNEIEG
ncbi:MAG: DUF998 domain-containing protein [Anaerolineae bacterium]|nr:DUF998 domain-containing protein [Anaerolineae bacterium]MCI0609586.1 DUF998 domain-containing protein [Anaerolineae bacterium]